MGHAALIIGRERRRRFSEDKKFELLRLAFSAGGNVAEVARRADICTSLLYRWRQAHMAAQQPAFIPAVVHDDGPVSEPRLPVDTAILVELGPGKTVKITADATPALVEAALRALR